MKLITVVGCIFFFTGVVAAQESNQPEIITEKSGNFTNLRVKGSLASKNEIGCIPIIKVTNQLTPPDLYNGVIKCLNDDKYEEAAELFTLAGMYGSFDAARVTDKTAGQAKTVLIMNTFNGITENKKKKFGSIITEELGKNTVALRNLCINIKNIGYPIYYPDYMILHGIKAFSGDPHVNALSTDFDSKATWNSLLENYLHCPEKHNEVKMNAIIAKQGQAITQSISAVSSANNFEPEIVRIIFTPSVDNNNNPTNDLKEISIKENRIYMISKWIVPIRKHNIKTIIYDGTGKVVKSSKTEFESKNSSLTTIDFYDINHNIDSAGDWKFVVYLDGKKKIEETLKVIPSQ